MRFINTLLPLAAISTAFVIPDEQITSQINALQKEPQTFLQRVHGNIDDVWTGVEESFKDAVAFSENAIDNAINAASETAEKAKSTFECRMSMTKFDVNQWLDSAKSTVEDLDFDSLVGGGDHDPHHPGHDHPKHPPHHDPHHDHKPNLTVYQLIASSKYTTKLAELINESQIWLRL